MPELSRFYGIVVQMYYGDHTPPHFHALYAGQMAVVDIESLAFILISEVEDAISRSPSSRTFKF